MPAAGSSRRSSRGLRREVSDVIEEDRPSQVPTRNRGEDIEEASDGEEQPRRPAAKKSKKGKSKAPAHADDEETTLVGEPPEDKEDPLATLGDQPLDQTQSSKLKGLAEDWASPAGQHAPWYGAVNDVGATFAEFVDGDEKGQQMLEDADKLMKGLLDSEAELRMHETALRELQKRVAEEEAIIDVVAAYREGVQKHKTEYEQKTSRQKYGKTQHYVDFRQAIFEVANPDAAMPPVTDFIPKEEGDESDDEDIEIGGVTQDYKCPLTLTTLVDPLTSRICHHSFSQVAIREYLANVPRKQCPTSGCNRYISLKDLFEDKDLKRKAQEAARRERMRESDDEDADVVE